MSRLPKVRGGMVMASSPPSTIISNRPKPSEARHPAETDERHKSPPFFSAQETGPDRSDRSVPAGPPPPSRSSRGTSNPEMQTFLIIQTMNFNTYTAFLTSDWQQAQVCAVLRNKISGRTLNCSFTAQPSFEIGAIQPNSIIPRRPTFVLNSKFPGPPCHPLTKRPGFFCPSDHQLG